MGVGTILDARKVVLMAFGEHKAADRRTRPSSSRRPRRSPRSFLQEHPDATFLLDEAAAGELTAFKRPWVVGPVRLDAGADPQGRRLALR